MSVTAIPGYAVPGWALPGIGVDTGDPVPVPVTNTLKGPDGSPVVGLKVYAQLVNSDPWLGDGTEVVNWATAVTDSTGLWTMDLYPMSLFAAGSYYRVREGANTWEVVVSDAGGLLHDQLKP